jgi:hypothetical protein
MKDYLAIADEVLGSTRLDLPGAMSVLDDVLAPLRDVPGGVVQFIAANDELARRFRETENAIDDAVRSAPIERDLRTACQAFMAVVMEAQARLKARQDAAATSAPPGRPGTARIRGGRP